MVTEYIVDEEAEQLKVAGVCRRADGVWATPVAWCDSQKIPCWCLSNPPRSRPL